MFGFVARKLGSSHMTLVSSVCKGGWLFAACAAAVCATTLTDRDSVQRHPTHQPVAFALLDPTENVNYVTRAAIVSEQHAPSDLENARFHEQAVQQSDTTRDKPEVQEKRAQ